MQKSRPLERGQCEDSNSALQAAKLFHIRRPYWRVKAGYNTLEANRVFILIFL